MKQTTSSKILIYRFVLIAVSYISIYLFNNRNQLFSATTVPLTLVDQLVPYTPWGVYVYLFAYFFPAIVFFRLWHKKNFEQLHILQWHLITTTLIANAFFLFFPTTIINIQSAVNYESLLSSTHHITAFFIRFIYTVDQPYNCFPSLHVASAIVAAMSLKNDRLSWMFSGYALAFLICLSTIQVKQHHFYDVIGGILLSLMTYFITKKIVNFYSTR